MQADGTATFTAGPSGNPPPTVQWQLSNDGGKTWDPIGGATSPTHTVDCTNSNQKCLMYRAAFTNPSGTVTTDAATLMITTALAPNFTGENYCIAPQGATTVCGLTTAGSPTPSISGSGLPVTDNGDGTGSVDVASTAADGSFPIILTATNGAGSINETYTVTVGNVCMVGPEGGSCTVVAPTSDPTPSCLLQASSEAGSWILADLTASTTIAEGGGEVSQTYSVITGDSIQVTAGGPATLGCY